MQNEKSHESKQDATSLLEYILEEIDPKASSSAVTPFSYFIEGDQLKIHYVRLEHFNKSSYQMATRILQSNHGFFITIFEDVFKNESQKVVERLKYLNGESNRIHGRNTTIQKITKPEALEFLKENHLNVAVRAKYNYGLFHKEKLVAVACFGQIINMRNGAKSTELIRFCNSTGARVVGGLTKLIKGFSMAHEVDEIMTYADKDWSDGYGYEKLGFTFIEEVPPTEFVIHLPTWQRYYAEKFKQENNIEELAFGEYRSVLNSGSKKFILYLND